MRRTFAATRCCCLDRLDGLHPELDHKLKLAGAFSMSKDSHVTAIDDGHAGLARLLEQDLAGEKVALARGRRQFANPDISSPRPQLPSASGREPRHAGP